MHKTMVLDGKQNKQRLGHGYCTKGVLDRRVQRLLLIRRCVYIKRVVRIGWNHHQYSPHIAQAHTLSTRVKSMHETGAGCLLYGLCLARAIWRFSVTRKLKETAIHCIVRHIIEGKRKQNDTEMGNMANK